MRTPLARLTRLCRPAAEFSKIAQATSVGFAIMGFIGFFVKLIFIPINNIIGAQLQQSTPPHPPCGFFVSSSSLPSDSAVSSAACGGSPHSQGCRCCVRGSRHGLVHRLRRLIAAPRDVCVRAASASRPRSVVRCRAPYARAQEPVRVRRARLHAPRGSACDVMCAV